jgi:hypothetical protein
MSDQASTPTPELLARGGLTAIRQRRNILDRSAALGIFTPDVVADLDALLTEVAQLAWLARPTTSAKPGLPPDNQIYLAQRAAEALALWTAAKRATFNYPTTLLGADGPMMAILEALIKNSQSSLEAAGDDQGTRE